MDYAIRKERPPWSALLEGDNGPSKRKPFARAIEFLFLIGREALLWGIVWLNKLPAS